MATILVRIRVRAGSEQRFEELARQAYVETHATDEGLRRYEFWRGSAPGSYVILESYAEFRHYVAHQRSDHHRRLAAGFREVIDEMTLEWIDPVSGGGPDWQSGPPTPADGDDERTQAVLGRLAKELPEWWDVLV
jgi:quinol monooxygenase YgiN